MLVEAFGNLINLTYLNLANNKMFGPLPATLAKLQKLTTLGLAENSFTGDIDVIAGLPVLVILFLRHNLFEGAIPIFSASVQVFDVDHNTFIAIAPGLCSNKNSMKALTNFGGCSADWPK
jgi:Leucine-rich repeat (LRR) protein